jgi:hypothetical protein
MKAKIKKLFTRPNFFLWGVGLLSILPLGKIFGLAGLIIQLVFLGVAVYNMVLSIVLRKEYNMFDFSFED